VQNVLQRTACLCGLSEGTSFGEKDGIELTRCACGIVRTAELDPQDYAVQYMNGFYHEDHVATVVGATIADRIEHDYDVGQLRMMELQIIIELLASRDQKYPLGQVLLDVGCGNGAMVMAALDEEWDAFGIDLYLPEKALLAKPKTANFAVHMMDRLGCTDLADCHFTRRTVDVLMLNDVIEHIPDPVDFLKVAAGICKRDGLIVLDTPDFSELSIDDHHVKPKEHIWYLSPNAWLQQFRAAGLACLEIRRPVAGKIVFYLQPDDQTLQVVVRGPTGLGDVHWILLKMRSLRRVEEPCTLCLTIPGNGDPDLIMRSKGFLKLLPFIDRVRLEIGPPVIVDSYCDDVRKPEYTWIANGHLERGRRIEEWAPHLPVDYHYPVEIPAEATAWAAGIKEQAGSQLVVMYASSQAWNHSVTGSSNWGVKDWAAVIAELSAAGIMPVLIGKHWDKDYAGLMLQEIKHPYIDLIGQTDEAQALALMKASDATIGMCAGITILAVHLRVRSIVFWPEVGVGNQDTLMLFNKGFQDDWVDPEQLKDGTYRPMSLGGFTVADVTDQLTKWGVL
jgi:2-polyprenyl-3-methyl-5-hydroxy-6-metoxy-1,4-benzoquinol methylase